MGSVTTEGRSPTLEQVWACDTLEKAEGFIKSQQAQGGSGFTLDNYVGNSFDRSSGGGNSLPAINPKTGKVFAQVPVSSGGEVDTALQAATAAFKSWGKTPPPVRSKYLQRVSQLIQENKELFAVWESIDQGKTLARARVEVDRAVSNFRSVASP